MRKLILLTLIFFLFVSCRPAGEKVERYREDGVEVIVNHPEPYKLKGKLLALHLQKEFSIDTENTALAELGLTDIETFDVDEEGNIFVIQWRTSGNYIYKFDSQGNFVTSFCRFGQGPGEIEWGGRVLITPDGELMAKDPSKRKFLVYDRGGNFLREVHFDRAYSVIPLMNGNYTLYWMDETPESLIYHVGIGNPEFKDVKELDSLQIPNVMNVRSPANSGRIIYGVSGERVYVGNAEKAYEIHAYNLDGALIRKVKKEYKPVEVSEEFKKEFFARMPEDYPLRDKYYFTKYWPPFRYLFIDDEGKLYVMTYEQGSVPGEYMYDIFNSEGIFVGRMSLGNFERYPLAATAKKSRLYHLKVKDSGYKELLVFRMSWE